MGQNTHLSLAGPRQKSIIIQRLDYTLVGAKVAVWIDTRGWELSLYGKNLTDEIYVTNAFGDGGVFISEPRTFGARLKFSF